MREVRAQPPSRSPNRFLFKPLAIVIAFGWFNTSLTLTEKGKILRFLVSLFFTVCLSLLAVIFFSFLLTFNCDYTTPQWSLCKLIIYGVLGTYVEIVFFVLFPEGSRYG